MSERRTDSASVVIAAPAEDIYRAFADADALMQWLPPGDMTGRALEYDFREHGRYCIELTYGADNHAAKTTGQSDVTRGEFLALEPNKRIVQSCVFEAADPAFAGVMILTWTFEPADGGTRATVTATNVPKGISAEDHDAGLRSSLRNLARYLESLR